MSDLDEELFGKSTKASKVCVKQFLPDKMYHDKNEFS